MIFKGDEREFIEINPSKGADSYGFLGIEVRVEVPGFTAHYSMLIFLDELQSFYNGLVQVSRQLSQKAEFHTIQGGLNLRCELQRNGRIECIGRAQDVDTGNALDFCISIENQALFNVLAQFEHFFKEMPIIR